MSHGSNGVFTDQSGSGEKEGWGGGMADTIGAGGGLLRRSTMRVPEERMVVLAGFGGMKGARVRMPSGSRASLGSWATKLCTCREKSSVAGPGGRARRDE